MPETGPSRRGSGVDLHNGPAIGVHRKWVMRARKIFFSIPRGYPLWLITNCSVALITKANGLEQAGSARQRSLYETHEAGSIPQTILREIISS